MTTTTTLPNAGETVWVRCPAGSCGDDVAMQYDARWGWTPPVGRCRGCGLDYHFGGTPDTLATLAAQVYATEGPSHD